MKKYERNIAKTWTLNDLKHEYQLGNMSAYNVQAFIVQNKHLKNELLEFSETLIGVDKLRTLQVFYHYINGVIEPESDKHGTYKHFKNMKYVTGFCPLLRSKLNNIVKLELVLHKFLSPINTANFLSKISSEIYIRKITKFLDKDNPSDLTRLYYISEQISEPLYCITCGKFITQPVKSRKYCVPAALRHNRTTISACEKYYIDFTKDIKPQILKITHPANILKVNIKLKNIIISYCSKIKNFNMNKASDSCLLYHWLNDINEVPKCVNCGKFICQSKFKTSLIRYSECCSHKCSQSYLPNVCKRLINNSLNALGSNTNVGKNERLLVKRFSQKTGFDFDIQQHVGKYFPDGLYKNIVLEINEINHTYPKQIKRDIKKYDFLISRGYKIIIIWEKLYKYKYHIAEFYKKRYGEDKILQYIIHNFEVFTDDGWCNFDGIIDNGIRSDLVKINNNLVCTTDHGIFTTNGKIEAGNCENKRSFTYNDLTEPMYIKKINKPERVYDLINVDNTKHSFFVNDGNFLVSNCILDEMAFVPPNIIDDFWTSVMPIISRSVTSKIIICSTSNGIGNKFHELWCDATISEHSVWTPIRIDWWDVPGRDEAWKKAEIESYGPGGERKFAQEYGNEFLGSSPTLLNAKALNSLIETEKEYRTPYTTKQIGNDKIGNWNIKIYEQPIPNNAYVLGCDVGEGIGSDYSVIRIFNITNLSEIKEVAYFSSNIINGPSFAYLITKLGIRYNYGAVALERNGIGKSTLDFLVNVFEYDNIVDVGNKSDSVGIFSSNSTKVDACIHFRDSLESGLIKLILRDRDSLLELQKFERVKSKSHVSFSASSGHDDTVMALIWGIYVTKLDILEMYYNITGYGKGLFGEEVPIICRPDSNSMIEDSFDTESMYEQKQLDYEKKVDEKLNLMSGSKSINEIVTNNYGLTTVDKNPEDDDDDFFVMAGNGVNLTDEEW